MILYSAEIKLVNKEARAGALPVMLEMHAIQSEFVVLVAKVKLSWL